MITGTQTQALAQTLSALVLLWVDLEPAEADGLAQVNQDQTLWQRCQEQPNSENDRKDIALKRNTLMSSSSSSSSRLPGQPCDGLTNTCCTGGLGTC